MPHLHDAEIADTHPTSHLALKNIVFATDLSPTAKKALPYAVAFARQYGAAVYVVHALHPNVFPFALPDTWPMLIEAEEQVREEGKKELETALQGISHELFFNEGTVWEILSDAIRKNNADLIVLGTHGRSGIGKAVLGSVAEEVFRQATCPVLTVGPYVSLGGKLSMVLNRILYATDFSRESLAAAPYAISLATENHAQLTLFHCTQDSNDRVAAFHALHDLVPSGADFLYPPNYVERQGSPSDEILKLADEENADLIVLGVGSARWRLPAVTHFAGSTAYKIVTRAVCPVLTVRS